MKILIDMTFVSPKSMNLSIANTWMRFLREVPDRQRDNWVLLLDESCVDILHGMFPDYRYITVNVHNVRKFYYDPRLYLVPFAMRRVINKSGCDVVFFPSDGNMYVKHKLNIASVVLINDLKFLKNDLRQKRTLRSIVLRLLRGNEYKRYKKTIERAALITTPSVYTKEDVMRFFPEYNIEKVHVIYHAIPEIKGSKKPNGIEESDQYILNVNTMWPFKNTITLLKAYTMLVDQYKGKLVLVGRTTDYWKNMLEPFIKNNQLEGRVIHLQNLEDTELRYLYEHADLFVTPSLHEGLGVTPVEAGMYRCPVISSRSESLPEATMEMVKYYEPATDEHALMKVMLELLTNPPTDEERRKIADAFREKYSPQHHVEGMTKLFEKLHEVKNTQKDI